MVSIKTFKKKAELFLSNENVGLDALTTKFYQYFDDHPDQTLFEKNEAGDFIHVENAKNLLNEDYQKRYFSTLEKFADDLNVEFDKDDVCFSKNFDNLVESLLTLNYCKDHPDLHIVKTELSGSPSLSVGVINSLESDLKYVSRLAVDDFRIYLIKKENKDDNPETQTLKFPWKRTVLATAALTTFLIGSIFYFIFAKKVSNIEKLADEKIEKIEEVVKPIQEKITYYEEKFNAYEKEIKSYLAIIKDGSGKEKLNPKLNKVIELASEYFEDNYRKNLEDNIYKSIKANLPKIIRDYFEKEYENFKKNPGTRDNLYSELKKYIEELIDELSK